MDIDIRNQLVRIVIGADATCRLFEDIHDGHDYLLRDAARPVAYVKTGTTEHPATSATKRGREIGFAFGESGVTARVRVDTEREYLVWEVVSVDGPADELRFLDFALVPDAADRDFTSCVLALDLRTNVAEIPQATSRLQATCYRKTGFAGARAALIACPSPFLRDIMQDVVTAAPELPHSSIGGPWALDGPRNRESYLFNFGGLTLDTVDAWIACCHDLGFTQIDFHGGDSFRFGDCRPNPKYYPEGIPSLRAVIDRLHGAGIQAGLHTYAFFIDKSCPWVTPVPDPGLGSDATFSLAAAVDAGATTIPVNESTAEMSAITGFFVRNSATLRIGEELVTYTDANKEPPYAFLGCTRGALGTRAARHRAGDAADHLKECFGLFTPGGDSPLLAEVAAKTAEAYNACGFDMIYLDALDGEDILGGSEWSWHYGSKFVFELFRCLERAPIMEMSTFHHHLWYVRARMGAWDHPTRSHKRFIDRHAESNATYARSFLPTNLGWWAVKTYTGFQGEPTFSDDIEYLCAKALGTGAGLSLMGVDPKSYAERPAIRRLAGIFRRWETLRRSGTVPDEVCDRLRAPGADFTLGDDDRIRPARYERGVFELAAGQMGTLKVENPFAAGSPRIRIEALPASAPEDDPGGRTIVDYADLAAFDIRDASPGMRVALEPAVGRDELARVRLVASRDVGSTGDAWAMVGRKFAPPLDLKGREALGLWVRGDGSGAVLNVQLRCPRHVVAGIGDHYAIIDFTGWRFLTFVEPESERTARYGWPYRDDNYALYREHIDYTQVETIGFWVTGLAPGSSAAIDIGPLRALPLRETAIREPSIAIGGMTIAFPFEIGVGCALEYDPAAGRCTVYGRAGEVVAEASPRGTPPVLAPGTNEVAFACGNASAARMRVSVGMVGEAM